MKFPNFKNELQSHNALGYHATIIKHNELMIKNLIEQKKWQVPAEYFAFLISIGSGRFFGGSLIIFELIENLNYSVIAITDKLYSLGIKDKIAIGYDGTTQGIYCLSCKNNDHRVYWIEWIDGSVKVEAESFIEWIESKPNELFSKKIYAGYKKIKDITTINAIIEKRKSFIIELSSYEKELTKPPNKSNEFLPRYNKLNLKVTKTAATDLDFFTIKCYRIGSPVGKDNIEYVSIPVKELPISKPIIVVSWLFDPFNMPFEKIIIQVDPFINLSSKMRVKYKEIKDYL